MARPHCDKPKRWWLKKIWSPKHVMTKFSITKPMAYGDQMFFNCRKIGDRNLFSVANYNESNPNVNKDFFASILMDVMPNIKWACCLGFENLMQRKKKGCLERCWKVLWKKWCLVPLYENLHTSMYQQIQKSWVPR